MLIENRRQFDALQPLLNVVDKEKWFRIGRRLLNQTPPPVLRRR
jgi:hypothetical protein